MESEIKRVSKSAYAVIGPEGATNFGIVKGNDGGGALIDADIRRIDGIEEALRLTGCAALGKTRMVERNINHFLTGKRY